MQMEFQSLRYLAERHPVEMIMMQKIRFVLLVSLLLLEGCTPASRHPNVTVMPSASNVPASDPQIPVTGGDPTTPADVVIDSLAIQVSDSFPPEYELEVKGALPSPCHQLRTDVKLPTMQTEIHVQIFSVYDPYKVCPQAAQPFEVSIPLGGYVRGSYTVLVNGKVVGEITP